VNTKKIEKHVVMVGAIHIAFGALGLLAACIVFVSVVGGGLLSGDENAMAITSAVGTVVASFLVLTAIPGFIGGLGLLKFHPWARILVLIVSVVDLMNIPFGTIVGVYSIWILIQDETQALFEGKNRPVANQ
jgi:hypothetical protein